MPHIPVKTRRAPMMCADKVTEACSMDVAQIQFLDEMFK